ncbi:rho-related BTB domain-containing protein 2-like isoform X2 [Anneissia japonica]|uniref:rho-related BTB domain-containing protein 2-like isoform X2 n=1 Tax=Anneissia japonica TaxID=1529436 RepID=UPI001425A0EE|nr:rho-related BTB domain-containing protein 2-like isoform X2 [Anneissia japonica]
MDHELPNQELIKCVVVGDSSVGKTRLIVARATGQVMSRNLLTQTHVPSVWAIDQYHRCQQVLENSWETIDGVRVSLRLWDTFGDHEKDRRFAYNGADVIVLCFSIADPISLANVKRVWAVEINRVCPRTPVILCGTKNDLRSSDIQLLMKDRSKFSHHCSRHRLFDPKNVLMPSYGRQTAKDIGAYYYETSSYTQYGITEVFNSAIRAALIHRRHHRFLHSNLRKVQCPLLQAPYLPDKPREPHVHIPDSTFVQEIGNLLNDTSCADVVFLVQDQFIVAHKIVLIAASDTFQQLFMMDLSEQLDSKPSSSTTILPALQEASLPPPPPDSLQYINAKNKPTTQVLLSSLDSKTATMDNTCLTDSVLSSSLTNSDKLFSDPETRTKSFSLLNTIQNPLGKTLDHEAFHSILLRQTKDPITGKLLLQHYVVLKPEITPDAFRIVLEFLYKGSLSSEVSLTDVSTASKLLGIGDLTRLVVNIMNDLHYLNQPISDAFIAQRTTKLCDVFFMKDMLIKVDDGVVVTHKSILMARCDPMLAMLGGHFRESSSSEVAIEGFGKETFSALLEYLYTDSCSPLCYQEAMNVIELANFLCLPRLVVIMEDMVIKVLKETFEKSKNDKQMQKEIARVTLETINRAKLHNAHQLRLWCCHQTSMNFELVQKMKLICEVNSEDRGCLEHNRWPPVYYITEKDYYDKCLKESTCAPDPRSKKHKGCLK